MPVPVFVVGDDLIGDRFSEFAVAICVTRSGIRVILSQTLVPDDFVVVRNLHNGIQAAFRVVGPVLPAYRNRQEWALEPLDTESEIWGALFAEFALARQQRIWLRCDTCKTLVLCGVSPVEYSVLLSTDLIWRYCHCCRNRTPWKF